MSTSRLTILTTLTLTALLGPALPAQAQHRGGGPRGGFVREDFPHGGYLPYRGYFPGFVGIDIGLGYGYGYPYYGAPVYVVPAPVVVQPPPTIIQVPAPPATQAPPTQAAPEPVVPPRPGPAPGGNS